MRNNHAGYTPFHGVGFQGRHDLVDVLVAHGLDPSDRHADGYTPIHRACWGREERHTKTVSALIAAGVSPRQRASNGKRPLDMTSNEGTVKVLKKAIAALNKVKKTKKRKRKKKTEL